MRAGLACAILLLLTLHHQASNAEDLYWEGEDESANEFLEVKEETGVMDHLKRLKRQFSWGGFSFFSSSTTTTPSPENYESITEDQDDTIQDTRDDDERIDGSGASERQEPDVGEKTLRVTFVVMEPYKDEYSNRDSVLFQNFSKTLADAVNQLFEKLPGTQKASLVRIQSRVADEFSCKVTLDIVTIGFDDTNRIIEVLRDHIKKIGKLGNVTVIDADFNANVVNPGYAFELCGVDEIQCGDSTCLPSSSRCNGTPECFDNVDEMSCNFEEDPIPDNDQDQTNDVDNEVPGNEYPVVPEPEAQRCDNPSPCGSSSVTYCPEQRCDGSPDCPLADDEKNCQESEDKEEERGDQELEGEPSATTPTGYPSNPNSDYDYTTSAARQACPPGEFTCDETRCIPLTSICDRRADCADGTDEKNCKPEYCGQDDFRCNNGKCIEASKRCNYVFDCPGYEDELNCSCREDEFKCVSDGICIEGRKRCDSNPNCSDGSDEKDCDGHHVCNKSGNFRCGDGHCISILLRCDGFRDCKHDGSDELGCPCSADQWQCDQGNCIKRSKRCDGRVDCPSDRSDERHCVGNGFFRCNSGKIIPESKRCNRQYDCPSGDYSDEQNCPCSSGDFKCNNGHCIPANKRCDRTHDCQDGSDELHCSYGTICMAYEFKCTSGQCVHAESFCNGTAECEDGSDEVRCPCKRGEFGCRDGSCINIALRCNGQKDCPSGEDEINCKCPAGMMVCERDPSSQCVTRCDGIRECPNGEDEEACEKECQHTCDNKCLDENLICDQKPDCSDGSDELHCVYCDGPDDFRCSDDECIRASQRCNGVWECQDGSDESDCDKVQTPNPRPRGECTEDEFRCDDGSCVNGLFRCDQKNDCLDDSDERNCAWYMARASRSSSTAPCSENEFSCYNGRCVPLSRRCDNFYDCTDFSDEQNCLSENCEYKCKSGECITADSFCDGVAQCSDGSDELDCPVQPFDTTTPPVFTTSGNTERTPEESSYPATASPVDSDGYPYYNTPRYIDPYTVPNPTTYSPYYTQGSSESVPCKRHEWRCENGPCIDARRRCDGKNDCPLDYSDEFDCPAGSPVALDVKVYPIEQTVRFGGDVVMQCRDEGPTRAPVRWVRENGRPLKPGFTERNGRLELFAVTLADAGVYICQTPSYLRYPGSEVRVTLNVEQPPQVFVAPKYCKPYEATCGNGQCIPKSKVCDGRIDCSDRSDEDMCNLNGECEPNQYRCENRKCVLKTWRCDGEDDCGDFSDEENCAPINPGSPCRAVEFACRNHSQCIPKSFHCDGRSDCLDKSDEIGCTVVYISSPPKPTNVRLNPGDTLTLTCEAVGTPTPLITWRLNWGHVPEKCKMNSRNGIGTLECNDMQAQDSGAYSCEAINNKGTVFATPDSIVFVDRTETCPTGFFNSEARSESECIRCFCFGESTQCRSADLFTFNMPTPLGEGGTKLMGVALTPEGEIRTDPSINNHYYYQSLRNGASVTKLESYDQSWLGIFHPYLTLPESYNGNQLTSYGGRIKFILEPHSNAYSPDDSAPTIIIRGRYATLFYNRRNSNTLDDRVEVRLTPGNWQKNSSRGFIPASREDIMMALDQVDMILLRADLNNGGVNITDFTMESAQHINVGLGAANLVEECTCPPGYEGLSCQKCAAGYVREKSGPWLGNCVKEECPAGTYGDPTRGYACRPCPCPLTNRNNQFARTCSLGPDGRVICDCFPGYEGNNCDICAPGYTGNPLVPGDSCKIESVNKCNAVGTRQSRPPDECICKDNVQGRYCDQCTNSSFYLSNDFRHGCASCFCTGVSQQCMSSNFRRKPNHAIFNVPSTVDQVKIYSSVPARSGPARYTAPKETTLRPTTTRSGLTVAGTIQARQVVYYYAMPLSFSGDKVTSYGGYLHYTLAGVPSYYGAPQKNNAADVQLISKNHLTFQYHGDFQASSDGILNGSVQFLEKGWQRSDGKGLIREHFLLALADVEAILIKATYAADTQAILESASIETAEPGGDGPVALHVEQCVCPVGYKGTSCEDCDKGYTRAGNGLYLELCGPCECNGHSRNCNPETGECYDCLDNTAGPKCDECKEGYTRDPYGNCIENENDYNRPQCECDPRGETEPCNEQSGGTCMCKVNVEGKRCDRCRPGTFGLDINNTDGCLSCYCSGVSTDCHEASHYTKILVPAPIFGDNLGGYTITDLNAERVYKESFVPLPDKSELMYTFNFPPDRDLYWSLPVFPGNRVLAYNGVLSLRQEFKSNSQSVSEQGSDVILVGEDISIQWSNPTSFMSEQSLSYQVPLKEGQWYILQTPRLASRRDFMRVLKNLKRVLVRATIAQDLVTTSIADVSMEMAIESSQPDAPIARGLEVCSCPPGHIGTSCENCKTGYYKDKQDYCVTCPCNGHDCQQDAYGRVICNCQPPYTGSDCSALGLIMELHPTIREDVNDPIFRRVTLTCKYRAPEPLTIKFIVEGEDTGPIKPANTSVLEKDGWHGEHVLHTLWDTRHTGLIYECYTINHRGSTLGVLTADMRHTPVLMPEPDNSTEVGESQTTTSRPPIPPSSVTIKITSKKIEIKEIGSSVNFTCQAQSPYTSQNLPVTWIKVDGELPQGRTYIDTYSGLIKITNLQISDSGQYICQTLDGISSTQEIATLKVPTNDMTLPVVEINPVVNEYYEGDRIELQCLTSGNPTPTITWQRASRRPFPLASEHRDYYFIIESAKEGDSGEYRCIASNTAGSVDRTAVITVRPRPSRPAQDKLIVNPTAPTINEGQSLRVVCTGSVNVPSGTIDWIRRDGDRFQSNVRSDNGVLYIEQAVPENQGIYICQSQAALVEPVQVVLTIVPQGTPSPDQITEISVAVNSLKIPTGESSTIDCVPKGYPLPLIKWTKYEGEFGPGTSQRGNTLIIHNAQESDQGYYVCEGIVDNQPIKRVYVSLDIERREAPRVQIWPNGEQPVTLGSEFEFHCRVVAGIPEPEIMWSRSGGRTLSATTDILPNNILKFKSVDVNDEGEYICSASNLAGTSSANAVLKVRSPPVINITPRNYLEVAIGDPVTVECRANGYPEPLVSIIGVNKYEIAGPTLGIAALRIPAANEQDDGDYKCTATSAAGSTTEDFTITVARGDGIGIDIEGSGERPDDDVPRSEERTATAGDKEVVIYCQVPSDTQPVWSRADRRPLQNNARQAQERLVITDVSTRDAGEYVCTIYDSQTHETRQAIITQLRVVDRPRITIEPLTQTVQPGATVVVRCVAQGDDITDVQWEPYRKSFSRRVNVQGPNLQFNRIEAEDAGKYICTVRTSYAIYNASAEVIVEDDRYSDPNSNREQTNQPPSNLVATEGERVTPIICDVPQGYTNQWTRADNRPLQNNARQEGSSLIIYNASKRDSGEYVCNVYDLQRNSPPTPYYTTLMVVAALRITLQPPTQTVLPGQSTRVECIVEGDNVTDVTWRPYNRDLPRRVEIRNTTLTFHQIEVEDAGQYECVARTVFASASKIAEVKVSEESDMATTESHENEQYVHVGAAVMLSCNVTHPDLTVRWTKDGRSLPRSVRLKSDGSLYISLAQKSDSGHYVCHLRDGQGRVSSNYINLHIEGIECLDTEFQCLDDSGCISHDLVCDGFDDCNDRSDEGLNCVLRDKRYSVNHFSKLTGPPEELSLVSIEDPRRRFRVGENVEILCRSRGQVQASWEKWDQQGTRQYVESRTYGDGAMMIINGVTETDAGMYRCTGVDPRGRSSYEDYNLEVEPGNPPPVWDSDGQIANYTAKLTQDIDMPCNHDLEEPVSIQWRREYAPLPSDIKTDQPILRLSRVTEADAGTYVCRVSNNIASVEAKAVLRIVGVIPRFDGNGWLALRTLRDAIRVFNIEIAFKPQDNDGLILYNSQYPDRQTDFLALHMLDGVPEFILETGSGPISVEGDRPLQLNEWHTIKLSKIGSKVIMNVDNTGPFVNETQENWVLDLQEPLYVGGVSNYDSLPSQLAGASGFVGCVSLLKSDGTEVNLMLDNLNKQEVYECDTCAPNYCQNNAVCQESQNDRGYICLCPNGYAGTHCERLGEACHPGQCGVGKCTETAEGYKCACPVTHTGKNCEIRQNIEYPAFTGSAYIALPKPNTYRFLKISMKVKPTAPVTDGIIMYCAESNRGLGGFTSLAVRNGRLEFRYDFGDEAPVVIVSNTTLPANEWTDVQVTRSGPTVSLTINMKQKYESRLDSAGKSLRFDTPMFVGGVDENIILNNNTGVTSGFMGCIKHLKTSNGDLIDMVNSSIQSANVRECNNADRGDIPEIESSCPCNNGGTCSSDGSCICPPGFTGQNCDSRHPSSMRSSRRSQTEPCAVNPCRNGGTCRTDYSNMMNYSCDCPLRFSGASCQISLDLYLSVAFNGNGYLELPASLINYDDLRRDPVVIAMAFHTKQNGVLLYQRQGVSHLDIGDFIMIRIDRGYVVLEWDMGSGTERLTVTDKEAFVTDEERHQIVVKVLPEGLMELTVDTYTVTETSSGLASRLHADSNIYIGGIPDGLNYYRYPGLIGCIEQIEFMNAPRGLNLGNTAVAARNAQRCKH